MHPDTAADYLARIGADHSSHLTFGYLCDLHERHLTTVPFENLDIHLGERIVLDTDLLADKIVRRRRGGFCYELNGLFGELLSTLGYRVTLLAARVFGEQRLGPPFDHLALRVDLDHPYLVDVGFGRLFREPLRLDTADPQHDRDGDFALRPVGEYGDLDLYRDGTPEYRLETRPRELAEFGPTCWYHQTSPDSHFTRGPLCSRPTATGRVTLNGSRLIRQEGEYRTERTLSDEEALAAYRDLFGMVLDRLPSTPAPA
jgi:N-hydroxyarylamine O-acetyltransferase